MFTGKTASGFAYEIPETAFDNMDLVDALADYSADDPFAISRVVSLVLGAEQKKRLYDYFRAEDGRVPTKAVVQAVNDIFAACGQKGKNS